MSDIYRIDDPPPKPERGKQNPGSGRDYRENQPESHGFKTFLIAVLCILLIIGLTIAAVHAFVSSSDYTKVSEKQGSSQESTD